MRKAALFLVMLVIGPLLGWLSARAMLERSAFAMNEAIGGWVEVRNDPGSLAGTYEAGSYLVRGQLPPPQHVRQFVRLRDDDGNSLRSDCATRIEGVPLPGRWWQIAASTRLETRSISAGSIVREANGSYVVTLWNAVSPGNWLQLGDPEDYSLRLYAHEPSTEDGQSLPLPTVRRLWC